MSMPTGTEDGTDSTRQARLSALSPNHVLSRSAPGQSLSMSMHGDLAAIGKRSTIRCEIASNRPGRAIESAMAAIGTPAAAVCPS